MKFQEGHKINLGRTIKLGLRKPNGPMSEEHKKKISEAHKALGEKHWSNRPETKLKRSIAMTGREGYWLGVKRPDISGSNHYLWNGKTKLAEQIRKCFEYRQWRSDVFTRDGFTCQECGKKGGKLNADHIKQFAFILLENNISSFEDAIACSELWNINNGRTLCKPCHIKIPVYSYNGERKIVFIKSNFLY